MAIPKTCIIFTFAAIAVGAIIVLVVVRRNASKLCENEGELYHKETSACYVRGTPGPCNNSLIFLQEYTKSQYGECNCRYTEFDRALLYHAETERCYFIFSQGFCSNGQWINVELKNGEPFCEENKCLHQFDSLLPPGTDRSNITDKIVPIKGGKCAILNKPAEGCDEAELVRFHRNYILPSCKTPPKKTKPTKNKYGAIGVPASPCPPGSFPSLTKCQPEFDFDFK